MRNEPSDAEARNGPAMRAPGSRRTILRLVGALLVLGTICVAGSLGLLSIGYILYALHPFNLRVFAAGVLFASLAMLVLFLTRTGLRHLRRRVAPEE